MVVSESLRVHVGLQQRTDLRGKRREFLHYEVVGCSLTKLHTRSRAHSKVETKKPIREIAHNQKIYIQLNLTRRKTGKMSNEWPNRKQTVSHKPLIPALHKQKQH